jgi:hypothetical protein
MTTRIITNAGFGCLIAALAALELIARRGTSRVPPLGQWLGVLMRPRTGRALILLGWLWLGGHYFAR